MNLNDKLLKAICEDLVLHTICVNKNREITKDNYKDLVENYFNSDNFKEDFLVKNKKSWMFV